jgi:hypothetical protein
MPRRRSIQSISIRFCRVNEGSARSRASGENHVTKRKTKMKTRLSSLVLIVAGCSLASAQTWQYVTLTATPLAPSESATNTYAIADAQAAEIISVQSPSFAYLSITKDGVSFPYWRAADNNPGGKGTIIQGPATFTLLAQSSTAAYLTLKLMPESFPPNQTLILPPGTNQVSITLESSTNLVNWSSATNGIFGSPDEARFFRIHMQKLN